MRYFLFWGCLMTKTHVLSLDAISDWDNVAWALNRASRGKRHHPEVSRHLADAEKSVATVSAALRASCLPFGNFDSFTIHDPKKRLIHAAPFLDRVAHHALVRFVEPRLERALLPSVFACRVGKGVHEAIYYAQKQSRRFSWVMHVDIAQYFPSIDHATLLGQLKRRFRGDGFDLLEAVIESHNHHLGRGLPIGALTSQHFANHYLSAVDRWCLRQPGIGAHCRYMDDFLFWAEEKEALVDLKARLEIFLSAALALTMKSPLIQRSSVGLVFCGIKIKAFSLKASSRRKRRFRQGLGRLGDEWRSGVLDSVDLQRSFDAVNAILLPANDVNFRKRLLEAQEAIDA
jgi:RNA-directed DNA polymerase